MSPPEGGRRSTSVAGVSSSMPKWRSDEMEGTRGHGGTALPRSSPHRSTSVTTQRGAGDRAAMMRTRIVVGVDGSEGSRRALTWAVEEAVVRGAVLEAVFVWQSPYDLPRDFDFYYPVDEGELAEGASARLAEALDGLAGAHTAVEVESVVLEGDPAEKLCQRADTADLLVVGSRGRGAFAGLLLGSVSAKSAHHARRPVVIVPSRREGQGASGSRHTGKIVVGADGSPGSLRALRWAVDEAAARGAIVEALMVRRDAEADVETLASPVPSPVLTPDDLGEAESARERLGKAAAGALAEPGVEITPVVLEGDPAETLCRYAADADMLVVGARGHGALGGLLLGSVGDKCAQRSPVPIVIVPTDRDVSP